MGRLRLPTDRLMLQNIFSCLRLLEVYSLESVFTSSEVFLPDISTPDNGGGQELIQEVSRLNINLRTKNSVCQICEQQTNEHELNTSQFGEDDVPNIDHKRSFIQKDDLSSSDQFKLILCSKCCDEYQEVNLYWRNILLKIHFDLMSQHSNLTQHAVIEINNFEILSISNTTDSLVSFSTLKKINKIHSKYFSMSRSNILQLVSPTLTEANGSLQGHSMFHNRIARNLVANLKTSDFRVTTTETTRIGADGRSVKIRKRKKQKQKSQKDEAESFLIKIVSSSIRNILSSLISCEHQKCPLEELVALVEADQAQTRQNLMEATATDTVFAWTDRNPDLGEALRMAATDSSSQKWTSLKDLQKLEFKLVEIIKEAEMIFTHELFEPVCSFIRRQLYKILEAQMDLLIPPAENDYIYLLDKVLSLLQTTYGDHLINILKMFVLNFEISDEFIIKDISASKPESINVFYEINNFLNLKVGPVGLEMLKNEVGLVLHPAGPQDSNTSDLETTIHETKKRKVPIHLRGDEFKTNLQNIWADLQNQIMSQSQ